MSSNQNNLDNAIDVAGEMLADAIIYPFSYAYDAIFEPNPTMISTQQDPDKRPAYNGPKDSSNDFSSPRKLRYPPS